MEVKINGVVSGHVNRDYKGDTRRRHIRKSVGRIARRAEVSAGESHSKGDIIAGIEAEIEAVGIIDANAKGLVDVHI